MKIGDYYFDSKGRRIKILEIIVKNGKVHVIGVNGLGIKHLFYEDGKHYFDNSRNLNLS